MARLFLLTRFLFAGGTGAAVNLGLLYLLTDWLGLWYLFSALIAFTLAMVVSFTLQKFWTFREGTVGRIPGQAAAYLALALFNILMNTLLLYLAVDGLGFHYLLGQAAVAALIATWNFLIYRHLIFHTGRLIGDTSRLPK